MTQRVRFGDLDAMQHMNNVEYLRFFETARIEYITEVLPEHQPGRREGFGFIFAECHIAYRAPAFYQDDVRTSVWVSELKRSSVRIEFEMVVAAREQTVAEGWGALVGYDYLAGKAQPLPDGVRKRLQDASR